MWMFLALGVLLGAARLLGDLARRYHQPAVLGEIIAGVLLGPTVLGAIAPSAVATLFPPEGPNAIALEAITTVGVVLFLLVAGMEVDLSTIFRLRNSALIIGVCSLSVPFMLGFTLGHLAPEFFGMEQGASAHVFAFFLGIALAVCALPVIIKILMDLNLFRSDLGMVVTAVAVFQDLVGWMGFAILLGLMSTPGGDAPSHGTVTTIAMTFGFAGAMVTVGRWVVDHILPWLQAHTAWPGGVLGFAMTAGFLGACAAEAIGLHAIFGAFFVGIAVGDSAHLRERTRVTIEQFVGAVFAPLFFASIGLQVNFAARFDAWLTLALIAVACVGETTGAVLGARWAGFPKRQAWAIGFALNARGAMGIVLALFAMRYGVIGERLFVGLVIMAVVTSMMAGPLMEKVIERRRPVRFRDHLSPRAFLPNLRATTNREAIAEIAAAIAPLTNLSADAIAEAVWAREQTMSTALPGGLAIPHARIAGLDRPIVAVGTSPLGVAFDAGDGAPTQLVLLVLTPPEAYEAQLDIVSDIARTFLKPETIDRAVAAANHTQFLALLNIAGATREPEPSPSRPAAA
jgi:Kef-type K+ transport system membrane component KefB/mannitol/fructose-specific phosphotransferase system IIA component (Ntr-type)